MWETWVWSLVWEDPTRPGASKPVGHSCWACVQVLSTCVISRFGHSVISKSSDPTDCSPPGSSVHGILQARILEWVAMSFSRGSSRTEPGSPALQADFTGWATREIRKKKDKAHITKKKQLRWKKWKFSKPLKARFTMREHRKPPARVQGECVY